MNHLASAINSLRLPDKNAIPAMPFVEEKALFDLLYILNMPVQDLARLIDDLPMSDWPLLKPDNSPECFHDIGVA